MAWKLVLSIPHENIRKAEVFRSSQWVKKSRGSCNIFSRHARLLKMFLVACCRCSGTGGEWVSEFTELMVQVVVIWKLLWQCHLRSSCSISWVYLFFLLNKFLADAPISFGFLVFSGGVKGDIDQSPWHFEVYHK